MALLRNHRLRSYRCGEYLCRWIDRKLAERCWGPRRAHHEPKLRLSFVVTAFNRVTTAAFHSTLLWPCPSRYAVKRWDERVVAAYRLPPHVYSLDN